MNMRILLLASFLLAVVAASVRRHSKVSSSDDSGGYEVWASDQSNSVKDQGSLGVKGSFLWIWDSKDIEKQLKSKGKKEAKSLPCSPKAKKGPCDLMTIFPQDLDEYDESGNPTGKKLEELSGFGRLHGVIQDPQGRYVNANIFAPGGGYLGVIDTHTKEAVGLFRVTKFIGLSRSVHMSFWASDGSAIIIANLNGKAIERINARRDEDGTITELSFDKSATLGLGKNMTVEEKATFFKGKNAFGNDLLGGIVGSEYKGLGDLTPNGVCKENGCGNSDGDMGGRVNNLPICPITTSNDLVYVTLAGGGLFVVDLKTSPMAIVGEYGNNVVYGAGCGGVEASGKIYVNSGVSASDAGKDQSMFAVWEFDDKDFIATTNLQNDPMPEIVFEDEGNTATGGNQQGDLSNGSGQIPGVTTRRDSHGMSATIDGKYIHVSDRVQNVMEAFDVSTFERFTYDLTSVDGKNSLKGEAGVCGAKSVKDDENLPLNDPAPDLFERTPDGKYLMIAFRGPAPVSVAHSAQGSCPGVGVVKLSKSGKTGKLVDVLRTTNTVEDNVDDVVISGGVNYSGSERSDIHGAIVVPK